MCVSGISPQSISVQSDRLLQEQHVVTTRFPVGESGPPPQPHPPVCVWSEVLPAASLSGLLVLLPAQVAGGGGASSQLEIWSLNRSCPRLVRTVSTAADVLCLELVREGQAQASLGNVICAGLRDGRWVRSQLQRLLRSGPTSCPPSIQVYGSVDASIQKLLVLLTPAGGPVLSLTHLGTFLFAGLANGSVAVFHHRAGGELGPAAPLPGPLSPSD